MIQYFELQIDGLPSPTHHFGGLSKGNFSSEKSKGFISNPHKAFIQSLDKMNLVHQHGVVQAFLPPINKPSLSLLKNLGHDISNTHLKETLLNIPEELLYIIWSSSFMWTANMGTYTPSLDSNDKKAHFTIANLHTYCHRSIEASKRFHQMKSYFSASSYNIHPQLYGHSYYSDEGAANHMRLCPNLNTRGLHIFTYNKSAYKHYHSHITLRQSISSQHAITKRHQLPDEHVIYLEQKQSSVKTGIFHNDVIAMSNEHMLITHEDAYEDPYAIDMISKRYYKLYRKELNPLILKKSDLTMTDVLHTYLFNSQLLSTKNGTVLIMPIQCKHSKAAQKCISLITSHFSEINEIVYSDVSESMLNGGGPACLRNRMLINKNEFLDINQAIIFNADVYTKLRLWVDKHYRHQLTLDDLRGVDLISETQLAQEELFTIIGHSRKQHMS